MKKVLFVLTSYRQGGISRSLQNLLSYMDPSKIEADVFALDDFGPYKQLLPNCTILSPNKAITLLVGRYEDIPASEKKYSAMLKVCRNVFGKFGISVNDFLYRRHIKSICRNHDYDAVIAFSEGVATRFVSYAPVVNKVAWVHCNYESYWELSGKPDEHSIYKKFRTVVNVSKFTKSVFDRIMHNYVGNSVSIYNVLDTDMMKRQAKASDFHDAFHSDKFTIVSIGRVDPVKNLSIIPQIAKELKDKGANFNWFIIGPKGTNEEMTKLQKNMAKNNCTEYVRYLGSQDNPYKYIASSDLLVNVSLSEACPYVINEAKVLHKPVVCSVFGSATEFIDNGVNGLIADYPEMADVICNLISSKQKYDYFAQNLCDFEYDNDAIVKQVESII